MKVSARRQFVFVYLILFSLVITLCTPLSQIERANAETFQQEDRTEKDNTLLNSAKSGDVKSTALKSSLYFEENMGQHDKRVRYAARGTSYTLFLTATEAVYVLESPKSKVQSPKSNLDESANPQSAICNPQSSKALALWMRLAGANADSEFRGTEMLSGKTNYFTGNDESKWRSNVRTFSGVRMNEVYSGVDVVWHGLEDGKARYDFVVKPNAEANKIEWEIEGANSVSINGDGDLEIKTELGTFKQKAPFSYQESNGVMREVASRFEMKGANRIGFAVDSYDRAKELIIDPTVELSTLGFSTYLGTASNDISNALFVDAAGNTYITGQTTNATFPTTAGAFDTTHAGLNDVFVTKINPAGTSLIYSTFLGGAQDDIGNGITVDSSGNAYITGGTVDHQTTDYPTTIGVFDQTHNGRTDVFVTKLNPTGSALVYSTFIGGGGTESGRGIAINSSGNVFVTGVTATQGQSDYPTLGGFDLSFNGDNDAFVTKLSANGSSMTYSTFIGGSFFDEGTGIAVDSSDNVFITGSTTSGTGSTVLFPTTAGALDTTHNGFNDVFVTKLNAAGNALIYSTFIGGTETDLGKGIAVDSTGNVYVTGSTADSATTDYPTTAGAFDTTYNGGNTDVFATKLNASGSALIYSTFIGSTVEDSGNSIAVDTSGNAYITGFTFQNFVGQPIFFPTTAGAFDTTHNNNFDAFLTRLNAAGTSVSYSTFIGGSNEDRANAIALDSSGSVYITGLTQSVQYPVTAGVLQTTHGGSGAFYDVFVTKFSTNQTNGKTPFDFDGDRKADISIYRPAQGEWWYQQSTDNIVKAFTFGTATDKIVPADYDGDGKTDAAFFRPSTGEWFVLRSSNLTFFAAPFGSSTDIPAPGDFDADGKADFTVFRPSTGTWFINKTTGGIDIIPFGINGDVPTVGDYDGDGKADIAIYRPIGGGGNAEWWQLRSTAGLFATPFGVSTDKPVVGDFTGDGKADIAFWRPSNANWFVLRSEDLTFFAVPFGATGDVPVAGDYDGDNKADLAVFRPSSATWFILKSSGGTLIQGFGISSDVPVASAFIP